LQGTLLGNKSFISVFVIILPLLFAGLADSHSQPVEQQINELLDTEPAEVSYWALALRDSTGSLSIDINSQKLIRPASNFKLLSSAAILDQLGPEHRIQTTVYGNGKQVNNTWRGDLIIRGRGDPAISGTLYDDKPFHVFNKIVQELKARGIQTIEGDIIGNDSFFDQKPYPKGWNWNDLSFYYGVEIDALSFNNNCVDLTVRAIGEVGEKPAIDWFPYRTSYIKFVNEQTIIEAHKEYDEFYQRLSGSDSIYLGSDLPQGYTETECLSVPDPSDFFATIFKQHLEENGITVTGEARTENRNRNWESNSYTTIYLHQSPELYKLIRQMNRESDNFYAEMLLKYTAAKTYGEPGTTSSGVKLIKQFAHSVDVDTTQIELSDASGLSTRTLITTGDLSKFLHNIRNKPYFDSFEQSLSVAGINGTLSYRMKNQPLRSKVVGKSGFMSGVRAISGYLTAKSGQSVTFSLVTNNYVVETKKIDRIQEQILDIIYQNF